MVRSFVTICVLSVLLTSCDLNWRNGAADSGGSGDSTTLSSISVTPVDSSITKLTTTQFAATGLYSDGTTADITASVTWTSGTESVAVINTVGLATGINPGTSVITATLGSVSGSTNLIITPASAVYSAGFYTSGVNNIAAVWKDGIKTDLACPTGNNYNHANSVYVTGGSVYVAGFCQASFGATSSIPVVWKDGVITVLSSVASYFAAANSVYVSGGSVYVAGYYCAPGVGAIAAVWKDGVRTDLTDAGISADARVNAVYVSGGSVYAVGYYFDGATNIAAIWVDGAKTDLTDPAAVSNATASSIYVSDGDVYIAGSYNDGANYIAVVWKNGVPTELTATAGSDAWATSIYVSGAVYVTGYYNDSISGHTIATVWKDTVRTDLTDGATVVNAWANSIYVNTGNVYVGGYYFDGSTPGSIGGVWTDGVISALPGAGAQVTSVFVGAY